ncbi:MAG: hypothetical protein P8103_01785 [Candidatus Thiodiazotropha sp.]
MTTSSPVHHRPKAKKARSRFSHGLLLTVGLLLLVAVLGLGLVVRQYEPDYYKPARVALVSARQQLEASYIPEQALLANLQTAHRDLQQAILSLQQAELLSADRQEIESLRRSLLALQDPNRLTSTTPQQLQQSYRRIEDQLNALIARIETSGHSAKSDH